MKGSRLSRLISLLLCAMLVFSLFPAQAFADDAEGVESEPPASDPVPVYTVSFVDWDGSAIASVLVKQGESATPPSHPERKGYIADGWDKSLSDIQSDLKVTALYKEAKIDGLLSPQVVVLEGNTININFYAKNGSVLIASYSKSGFSDDQIKTFKGDSGSKLINNLSSAFGTSFVGRSGFSNSDFVNNGSLKLSGGGPSYTINAYLKIDISTTYTVLYVNADGEQINDSDSGSGNAGQEITVTASGISGYSLITTNPQSVTLTYSGNFITFVYEPVSYSISYILNEGENHPENPTFYTIESDLITLAAPTREGYTFMGWSPTDTIPTGSTGDKEFSAIWEILPEAHSFSFTFMQISGSDEYDLRTYRVSHNDTSDFYYPVKLGYKIYGTSAIVEIPNSFTFNHTTANRFSDPFYFTTNALGVDQSETCILYWWNASTGSWVQVSTKASSALHKVTYDASGGTLNDPLLAVQYAFHGTALTEPTAERTGYTFNTWNYAPVINPGGVNASSTVTASWTADVYGISYVLNEGENHPENPTSYTPDDATINLLEPTRAGYNFAGWSPTDSIPAGSTGDKTFTAMWSSAIVYNITYNLAGGVNDPTNPTTYTVESGLITLAAPTRAGYNFLGWNPTGTIAAGSTGDKAFTAKWSAAIRYSISYTMNGGINNILNPSSYTVNSATITLRDPVRLGYDFAGWTPTNTIPTGSTGNKVFIATWTPKVYDIHYDLNGGINNPANPATFTTETPTINLANPTRAGYNFWFWFPLDTIPQGSIGDRYVWAIWSAPINYTITYNLNGGTNNPANPNLYNVNSSLITLADPTRAGYTFTGWTPTGSIPAGSTGNKTFTATWSDPIVYDITYDLAGGINDPANPATYTVESDLITLADPTRAGYDFTGWTPSGSIPAGSTGNKAFTATWSDPIAYDITYDLAGGVNDPANPATYTIESALITLAAPTRAGYDFTGWTPTDNIPAGSTGDKAFTATWSAPIVYPITYVMNGGVNAGVNPATYTVESPTITLAAPAQAGYLFLGWTPAGIIPAGSTGALVFTANWSAPIVYDITYVMNGGINAAANPATYTVESPTITLAAPTREGYDFLGWTPTNSIPAGSVGDVTFTATWSDPRVHTVTYFVSGGTEPGLDGATPYAVYTNVAYGAIVPVPTNPSQDDFTFDGWTTSIPVNMPDADVVIYGSMTRMPALQEIITNERTPLAGPTWSLLNLILAALTALGIGSILTLLSKKRAGKLNGKAKVFSLSSLLPAAGAIVAFLLTQNLSGSMVFADQWTILMAGIAAVQAIVVALSLTGTKKA